MGQNPQFHLTYFISNQLPYIKEKPSIAIAYAKPELKENQKPLSALNFLAISLFPAKFST